MRTLGNILWFIFGGVLGGLAWIFAGCIWCITIIGIPVGLQCFKFASLAFWPFGKEIVYENGMFSFGEFNLDPVLWLGNGIGESDNWFSLVHYDCWNSIWEAVF